MGLSKKEIALLGLVNEYPRHGYEIEHVIEERHMRYWTEIGFSSIYHVLKQLEKKGFILQEAVDTKSQSKKVYKITESGRAELKESIMGLFSACEAISVPYLLGIINLGLLSNEELINAFEKRLEMIDLHVSMLEKVMTPYLEMGFREPKVLRSWFFAHAKTERDWIENFILEIKNESS